MSDRDDSAEPPSDPPAPPAPHPGAEQQPEFQVRARHILRVPKIWVLPLTLATIFVALMSVIYIGSVVNPTGHLRGLPVMVVNEDRGANLGGQQLNVGDDVAKALLGSKAVTARLALVSGSLQQAERRMDRAGAYATVVIPPTFTRSLLVTAGAEQPSKNVPEEAAVALLENIRLGSIGVNLAAGVTGDAVAKISPAVGEKLSAALSKAAAAQSKTAAEQQQLAIRLKDPVVFAPTQYRPLPDHSALGLSAFYASLLAMMAGFLGAMLINSSVDAALGFAATDIGPRWRVVRPKRINRLHTFLVKFSLVIGAAPILTGVLMLIAVVVLQMHAPSWLLLWAVLALAAVMVGAGTLALLAAFGSIGQLLAMILLIYLSLASSGGTIPVQALPGILRWFSHVEPLRQILDGARAIMYFDARGDAGLTSSLITVVSELVFWTLFGLGFTAWYDKRKLYRVSPEILSYVEGALDAHEQAGGA